MLRTPGLDMIRYVADCLTADGAARPWQALSLSYQDVIASEADLRALLGAGYERLPFRRDSPTIVHWHKCEHVTTRIPDWHELLRLLDFVPLSTDVVPARGCELYLDLNTPAPAEYLDRFALVIDNAAHHCFDAAQALANVAAMTRAGGYVLHATPLVMINHGFYTFSPTLLHDFYTRNGFSVAQHHWFEVPRRDEPCVLRPVDPTRRMKDVTANAMQLFLARRDRVMPGVHRPVQTKFVRHPNSALAEGEER